MCQRVGAARAAAVVKGSHNRPKAKSAWFPAAWPDRPTDRLPCARCWSQFVCASARCFDGRTAVKLWRVDVPLTYRKQSQPVSASTPATGAQTGHFAFRHPEALLDALDALVQHHDHDHDHHQHHQRLNLFAHTSSVCAAHHGPARTPRPHHRRRIRLYSSARSISPLTSRSQPELPPRRRCRHVSEKGPGEAQDGLPQ